MDNNNAVANYNANSAISSLSTFDIFTNPNVYKTCEVLARSNFVPDSYKGKTEDVMAALSISITHRMDLFTVMQNLQMVKGNARWKSDYTIGAINSSGLFASNLMFDIKRNDAGEAVSCTAWAVDKVTGEKVYGTPITWDMVVAEGWNKDSTTKSGYVQKSKWNTMREQMFKYRAAVFFARTNCPEVLMGYYTVDEGADIAANQALEYEDKTEQPVAPEQPAAPEPPQISPKVRLWRKVLEMVGGDKGIAESICKAVVSGQEVTEDNIDELISTAESMIHGNDTADEIPEHLVEEPF